jgi:hypothetical protein
MPEVLALLSAIVASDVARWTLWRIYHILCTDSALLVMRVMLGDTLDAESSPHDARASTVPWMGMAVED